MKSGPIFRAAGLFPVPAFSAVALLPPEFHIIILGEQLELFTHLTQFEI